MAAGSNVESIEVDISDSTTKSDPFGVGGYERGSVQISAAFTNTTLNF